MAFSSDRETREELAAMAHVLALTNAIQLMDVALACSIVHTFISDDSDTYTMGGGDGNGDGDRDRGGG